MNGEYLYNVFVYCGENKIPDLTIALAVMSDKYPIPDGITYGEMCKFIGRNYNVLVDAYAKQDIYYFCDVVDSIVAAEAEEDK